MHEFRLAATLHEEGNPAAAIQHLNRALELDEENARAHLLMGYVHMERSDFTSAEPALRRGIALLEAQNDEGAALAEARNLLGAALIHLHRPDDAIPILQQSASDLLNTAPQHAWGNLGLAYISKEAYDQALEALQQSVRSQPRFCRGYYLMGQVHFARDDMNAAEESLTRAVEADEICQRYQDAFKLRGEVRARLGLRDDAIADFERCVEIQRNTEAGQACQRFLEGTH